MYLTNQMGDVISITDANGNEIVQYEYDAWGKCVSTVTAQDNDIEIKLANINPIRYRGYYLDNETGYYYLQSRYYDPSICRFINSDIPEISQKLKNISVGINLFAYCKNNAINYSDYDGYDFIMAALSTLFWPLVLDLLDFMAAYFWYVIVIVLIAGITATAVNQIINYAKKTNKGKKAKDSSKNEPHGNESKKKRTEKQAKELKEKAKKAKSRNEKRKLLQKAKNVIESGKKAKKGETHHRR